jgi:hypothetical protein
MKLLLAICLLTCSISIRVNGQDCNCKSELINVKNKIETSYAGFRDKVTARTKNSYDQYTLKALARAEKISYSPYCIDLINNWLSFFRDGHIQIGRNRISKSVETLDFERRKQSMASLKLSDATIAELQQARTISGIYWDPDSTLQIALVKNKNDFRDYAGILISSKNKNYAVGQIILELKQDKSNLKGISYDRFLIPTPVVYSVQRNTIGSWQRAGTKKRLAEPPNKKILDSKLLSNNTLYLKIASFNQIHARGIDSLVKANQADLATVPNLILDLRNNGGGADFAYRPITPYLYSGPTRLIGADVLATVDNIKGWQGVASTDGLGAEQQNAIKTIVEKMERNVGSLVSVAADQDLTLPQVLPNPKKIVILIDRHCGSTAEEFLLQARQSSKVTFMGEPTAGVLDYANIRGTALNCLPYMIYWATSRSRRIDMGLGIDNLGIQPDIKLNENQDWILSARKYLEQ